MDPLPDRSNLGSQELIWYQSVTVTTRNGGRQERGDQWRKPREMAAGFSTTPKSLCQVTIIDTDLDFGYFSRLPEKQVVCKTQQDLDTVLVQPSG